MERSDAEWIINVMKDRDARTDAEIDACDMAMEALSEPQITRCIDCERCTTAYINGQLQDFCRFTHVLIMYKENSFCSWAERKKE